VGLSIETAARGAGVMEIAPCGEMDLDTAYKVRDAVAAVLANGRPARIELDMHLVTLLDSIGISALVAAFQVASVSGVPLAVTRPSRFVHRQLWVTGLLGLFGAPEPDTLDQAAAGPGAAVRGN
jgi:anti-sigma B factor antagonist